MDLPRTQKLYPTLVELGLSLETRKYGLYEYGSKILHNMPILSVQISDTDTTIYTTIAWDNGEYEFAEMAGMR